MYNDLCFFRMFRGLCVLGLFATLAPAAQPDLQSLNVRGLQVGGTTTLTIDGDQFGKAPRLLLPFPSKQTVKAGSTDKKATLDISLENDVAPGYYNLCVATDGGVSLPMIIGVDKLPQRALTPTLELTQIAVTGSATGSSIAETTFTGSAGQKLLIEVEAQRLGSKLRPVVHLYGPKRRQLAWSWPMPSLIGDTRLEATLPESGTYAITVHDQEYAGPGPGHFRLKVGQWNYADQVFPPVIGKGARSADLIGAGLPVRVEVPATTTTYALLPWPKDGTWSGPRPVVATSGEAEVLEQPTTGKSQDLPPLPMGVSGRLATVNEEDRFRLPVTPKTRVRLELFAERIGSPLDVALVIRNEMGTDLARAEESPGSLDPVLEYAVPDQVTAIQVAVVDAQGRGSPRGIYRLTADLVQPGGNGDFRLYTPAQRLSLPVGGSGVLPVFVERRRYAGPIALSASGLPGGAVLEGATIPPGNDGTLVVVRTTTTAPAAITAWKGRGTNGVESPVVVRGHPLERLQPWLAGEIAVSTVAEKADTFAIAWGNLPANAGLSPGGRLTLPLSVKRPDPATLVRFTLVTSQAPPMVNNQPNPNAAIRVERAVEIGAKTSTGELPLLIPPDLPADSYQLAVQAEILSSDKRTVYATVYTPVKTLAVKLPVAIKLESPSRVDATLDPKAPKTIEVVGRVERQHGYFGNVALTLTGLPAGVRADPVTVKPFSTKFAMKIVLPPNVAVGEVKGLKLNASAAPDVKQPNIRVRSRDVDLVLNVLSGKK